MTEKPTYQELEKRVLELEMLLSKDKENEKKCRNIQNKRSLYDTVIMSSSDPISLINNHYEYLMVNKSYEKYSGIKREEIIGKKIYEILGKEIFENIVKKQIDKCLQGEKIEYSDWFHSELCGKRYMSVKYYPYNIDNSVVGVVNISYDITELKLKEEELNRYENIVSSTNDGIALLSKDYRYIIVNNAYEKFSGMKKEALLGIKISEYLGEDIFLKYVKDHFDKCLEGNTISYQQWFEYPVLGRRFVEVTYYPYKDRQNRIGGVIANTRDITERKLIDAALEEREKKFRATFEGSHDAIVLTSADGKVIDCNQRALELFGLESKQGLRDKRPSDFSPPFQPDGRPSSEVSRERIQEVLREGRPQQFEWVSQDNRGRVFPVEIILTLVSLEGEVVVQACMRDITVRKQAEEALRQSEEKFYKIFNSSPVVMSITTFDEGVFLDVNESFLRLLGLEREEVVGKSAAELGMWQRSSRQDILRELERSGFAHNKEVELVLPSGKVIPLLWFGDTVQILGKRCVVASGFDLTERKEAEEERKGLEAQLRQTHKMQAIGTLAGGIAHDFNNILSIILGNTEMAMHDLSEWSPAKESLNEAREASLRARDLVSQLLLFAREMEQDISIMRVEPIARETLKMLRASLPSTVEIHRDIREGIPPILADPSQIQQIIMNLCTNSAQVMEAEGGRLEFTLDSLTLEGPLDTATGLIPEGLYVRIQVRDTGPGIAVDSLEHIFEPFFTTKGVGEGTGLGLAVVHGIVQDRQGGIVVESEVGKGTLFTVYLPAAEGVQGELEVGEESDRPAGVGRILFVDDEPMIMRLGQRLLEREGYEVETRANGTDALECFRRDPTRFDLVVTDMTMPGMTGDKFAKEILKIRSDIPVILASGYSRKISEEKVKEIGIRDFVMKPLTAHELANTVRRVLDDE